MRGSVMSRSKAEGSERVVAVGWTGGIACGKSTAAGMVEEMGVPVLDTDRVAHEVMAPGLPVYERVVERFGPGILTEAGEIDRRILGSRVFREPAARMDLNRLVHPAVGDAWRAWLRERAQRAESGVVMIPLLFEVGAAEGWDAIVCVAATEETVVRRLAARGLDRDEAMARIGAQWPIETKVRGADHVIWNDDSLDNLRARVTETWRRITGQE